MYYELKGKLFGDENITQLPEYAVELTKHEWINRTNSIDDSTLAQKEDYVWRKIKAKRDEVEHAGVKVLVDDVEKWIHTSAESRIQHIGLTIMGANIPPDLQWKTMDGTYITMTQAVAADIFGSVAALDIAAFTNSETHKANMIASGDPYNYDFSGGWGEEFGG